MIGIICAEQEELEEVTTLMDNFRIEQVGNIKFIVGNIFQVKCILALSGVGKVHAAMCAQTLIIKYSPDLVLNVGVAGGITQDIKIGDIVVATAVIQHDFDVSGFGNRKKGEISGLSIVEIPCSKKIVNKILDCCSQINDISVHIGTVLTGDQFINSKQKLSELKDTFNGIACEMEAGSIGQVCYLNKVDFGVIRAISDTADENANFDFPSFIKTSSKNAAIILSKFIKSYQD